MDTHAAEVHALPSRKASKKDGKRVKAAKPAPASARPAASDANAYHTLIAALRDELKASAADRTLLLDRLLSLSSLVEAAKAEGEGARKALLAEHEARLAEVQELNRQLRESHETQTAAWTGDALSLRASLETANARLAEQEARLAELQEQNRQLREARATQAVVSTGGGLSSLDAADSRRADQETCLVELQEQNRQLKAAAKELERGHAEPQRLLDHIRSSESALREMALAIEERDARIAQLSAEVDAGRRRHADAVRGLEAELGGLATQLQAQAAIAAQAATEAASARLVELQEKNRRLAEEHEVHIAERTALERDLTSANQTIAQLELDASEAELLKEKFLALQRDHRRSQGELLQSQKDWQRLRPELEEARNLALARGEELRQLQHALSEARSAAIARTADFERLVVWRETSTREIDRLQAERQRADVELARLEQVGRELESLQAAIARSPYFKLRRVLSRLKPRRKPR